MEEAIGSPDVSVTYYYIGTLMEFAQIERLGPTPPYTARTTEEIKRWVNDVEGPRRAGVKAIEDEYFEKLAQAVKNKRGAALSASLDTLINRGPKPAPPSLIQALTENFLSLPETTKQQLLTTN